MSAFFDDIKNDKKSAVNDFLTYIGYPILMTSFVKITLCGY